MATDSTPSAGYVGDRWRLTAVTDRRGTTDIPPSVDAWLQLAADGQLLASDDVNTTSARFTTTGAGFDVSGAVTTAVAYVGDDPARVAAILGIDAVTKNEDGDSTRVTVLSADREHLNVHAGGVWLTFVRSGPAAQ